MYNEEINKMYESYKKRVINNIVSKRQSLQTGVVVCVVLQRVDKYNILWYNKSLNRGWVSNMRTYKFKLYTSKKNKKLQHKLWVACKVYNHCIALL